MTPSYTELDVSYYPAPLVEEESFDFSLFENKPPQIYLEFDADTIELLDRDKFATGG